MLKNNNYSKNRTGTYLYFVTIQEKKMKTGKNYLII